MRLDWRARAAVLLAIAAALCTLWWTGALAELARPERMRELLAESGWVGPLVWLAAFVGLQPFGMPGAAFMIPAALAWPAPVAIALCLAGAVGAGAFAFALARWLGPEAVTSRLPERVRRYTEQARERGFRTAVLARLVLFLFPPAHWALGVSGMRFGPFVAGSALGFAPGMTVWILGTRQAFDAFERAPSAEAIGLGVAAVALGGAFLVWRRRLRRAAATPRR